MSETEDYLRNELAELSDHARHRIHTLTQQVERAREGLREGLRGLRYARQWSPGEATTVAEAQRAVEAALHAMEGETG